MQLWHSDDCGCLTQQCHPSLTCSRLPPAPRSLVQALILPAVPARVHSGQDCGPYFPGEALVGSRHARDLNWDGMARFLLLHRANQAALPAPSRLHRHRCTCKVSAPPATHPALSLAACYPALQVPCPLPDCKAPISAAECGLVLTPEEAATLGKVREGECTPAGACPAACSCKVQGDPRGGAGSIHWRCAMPAICATICKATHPNIFAYSSCPADGGGGGHRRGRSPVLPQPPVQHAAAERRQAGGCTHRLPLLVRTASCPTAPEKEGFSACGSRGC